MLAIREQSQKLTDTDFNYVCSYVYDRSGIVLGENKKEMVYRRLTRIIRERKLNSFSEYCSILKENPDQEQNYLINAITTNLTSFFREAHHFCYLTDVEIPKLLKKNSKKIRVWSSASSTGEEPYSLSITFHEAMKGYLSTWDVKILATDIDSNVLNNGKIGIYDSKTIEDIPVNFKKKYFTKGTSGNEHKVKVAPCLQNIITFKLLNLMHDWPMKGPFDVIFCRNVIIYFDKKTQMELFSRYYELLAPGGLLILGHSENLGDFQKYFENVGRTIFRKIG